MFPASFLLWVWFPGFVRLVCLCPAAFRRWIVARIEKQALQCEKISKGGAVVCKKVVDFVRGCYFVFVTFNSCDFFDFCHCFYSFLLSDNDIFTGFVVVNNHGIFFLCVFRFSLVVRGFDRVFLHFYPFRRFYGLPPPVFGLSVKFYNFACLRYVVKDSERVHFFKLSGFD